MIAAICLICGLFVLVAVAGWAGLSVGEWRSNAFQACDHSARAATHDRQVQEAMASFDQEWERLNQR